MRIAFMGTPDFAVPALLALHAAGHEIACVYSQQPRPAGRGQAVRASPVQREAERLGIEVRTPAGLRRDEAAQAAFAALELDVAVVAAYGLLLPQAMLAAPRLGCLNIHASLLPRWRGANPIRAAILAGDRETGVTVMQMEAGLDTGPMLLRGRVPITEETDTPALHDALAALGARLIVEALQRPLVPVPQPDEGVCVAPRLSREDGRIDWSSDAAAIGRQVRALTPWPGTFTLLGDTVIKILAARALPDADKTISPDDEVPLRERGTMLPIGETPSAESGMTDAANGTPAGTVLDDHLTIACGTGRLRIERLQWPGRGALEAGAFLRGRPIPAGTRLG